MSRVLVLDFDGTMTDAEAEGAPFTAGYFEDVAFLVGRPVDEVRELAARFEAEITANSQAYGWTSGDKVVAPAAVDPYLRIQPVAGRVFDEYGCFSDPLDRERLLDGVLYKYNYGKTAVAFRPGAREALLALTGTATWVVTNSHTEPVQEKIRRLGETSDGTSALEWLVERVRGRAQKYRLDDDFDEVPESMSLWPSCWRRWGPIGPTWWWSGTSSSWTWCCRSHVGREWG
ncbi:MAG: HAD family hydrolase [Deltaproteobacteria bacterium]|nr:HAD family hydrolase [Deltaproteobacteria bacterium]